MSLLLPGAFPKMGRVPHSRVQKSGVSAMTGPAHANLSSITTVHLPGQSQGLPFGGGSKKTIKTNKNSKKTKKNHRRKKSQKRISRRS